MRATTRRVTTRATRRVVALTGALGVMALVASACVPPPAPPAPAPYLDQVYDVTVTPSDQPVEFGRAPAIDANYGGLLYPGTPLQRQDPRPPLDAEGRQRLRLWIADPGDTLSLRPAVIWVHGGGFAEGIDHMYPMTVEYAAEYAKRGYVGFSVEYRIDTTFVGSPGNLVPLCIWVQANQDPNDPLWVQRRAQCERNILAAQYDVQAAVRWVRHHAAELRVNPHRIAVGGGSAGAVTAANVGFRSDDVSPYVYFTGDQPSTAASKPQAVFGASGCAYLPGSIGPGDTPSAWIHSELDAAVPYSCIAGTVTEARAAGLVAELTSYCGNQSLHARDLYLAHRAETDAQWTAFLARELGIYSGMRPHSTDPACPGF